MLLWFILTGISVIFVVIDVWRTPEVTALRWGFIVLTVFAGPVAAFFYVLSCREPLPGTHEQYVAPIWKQVLGSTMHCASGDGLGIITGAAIASILELPFALNVTLEYVLGFGFGWLFFQAFAMRDMVGGNYLKSLKITFIPEFFSMNLLMAGMLIVSKPWMAELAESKDPFNPSFWFIMSMALIVGFICAYPINWWLVTRHLKHGMMTIRPTSTSEHAGHDMASMNHDSQHSEHDGASVTPKEGEQADRGMTMPLPPPLGTILMVGVLSAAILAAVITILVFMLPAAN
jgi:hypothetical protein|tara:strand:- start:1934 stop:2800 length:867 start_codon:yes stop_codon:yes gene_type:complete